MSRVTSRLLLCLGFEFRLQGSGFRASGSRLGLGLGFRLVQIED